ncbi:Hypothetical predicted protein [Paramuricea clavata]|uniref:Uncharacterized protein n=1 Tax=Paramuricea clavata TaxID=317549 RepID=A0A6S7KD45_PARCT|nr:Hypothetical predicted protein [Paramuricea clavata]
MKYLADSSGESSTSPVPSVLPSPGGGVLACISGNPVTDMAAKGTLTIFCYKNGHHYALTCFHVVCANDTIRFNSTFNINIKNIQEIHNSLPAYEFHAREERYWFTEREIESNNEPIAYEDDLSHYTPLGDFHNYRFDNECDILSVKVPRDTEINCEMADVTSQDWQSIWNELVDIFAEWNEGSGNPVIVEKIGFSSGLTNGHVVTLNYNNPDLLFKNAIAVKGPFFEGGDSGSPVFFRDKCNQKQVFAYGVCEVDELLSPEELETTSSDDDDSDDVCEIDDVLPPEQPELTSSTSRENVSPEQTSSDDNDSETTFDEKNENSAPNERGPYFICFRLNTALEKLEFDRACISDCGRN